MPELRCQPYGAGPDDGSDEDASTRIRDLLSRLGTLYSYDTDGNLLQVSDHQGDDVKYVDKDNPTSGKYDRFGRVSQIEQEICDHPSGFENGGCTDATPAKVQYSYDVGGQLSEVRVKEPRVAGNDIVTGVKSRNLCKSTRRSSSLFDQAAC